MRCALAVLSLARSKSSRRGGSHTESRIRSIRGGNSALRSATSAARELIAREGYDPVFGARPLKRVIQKKILDALSLEILAGNFKEGDKIKVDVDKKAAGSLIFQRT